MQSGIINKFSSIIAKDQSTLVHRETTVYSLINKKHRRTKRFKKNINSKALNEIIPVLPAWTFMKSLYLCYSLPIEGTVNLHTVVWNS